MRPFATVVAIFATAGVVHTQEIAPSDIENLKVNATATMAMLSRNAGREFSGQTLLQWTFEVGPQKDQSGRRSPSTRAANNSLQDLLSND